MSAQRVLTIQLYVVRVHNESASISGNKGFPHLGPGDFIIEPEQIAVCHLVHKVGIFKGVTCISKAEPGT